MTNPMQDVADNAQTIFIIGSNTTEQHPVFGYKLRQAVLQRGAKLIVADPRRIKISDLATLHIQQKPGTDVALLNGLMHIILKNGWQDQSYIDERCENFEDFQENLAKYTPELVSEITGVPAEQLQQAAEIMAMNSPMAVMWAMGITQHTTGVMNVFSMANLQMLLGNMGVPGGGANPLRGQNNVQGACDMGALVNVFSGYQRVTDEAARDKFNKAWQLEKPGWQEADGITPLYGDKVGKTITELTGEAKTGDVRALYILGENPIMSDPDSNHVRECLQACEFILLQEIFYSETADFADVILPGASFAEKDGTFTNTERRVQRINRAIEPIGESRPDWQIVSDLAPRIIEKLGLEEVGPNAGWQYDSPAAIMEEIAALTPIYAGIDYERLDRGEQLQWPVKDKQHPGTPILHVGQFSRGKGQFQVCEHLPAHELPDEEYPFFLTTGRVLYHWHGAEMTRRVDGLVDLYPESLIEVSLEDAARLEIKNKEKIRLTSRRGEVVATALVTDRIAEGVVFGGFHYPGEQNVNNLTILALDPIAKIPEYKVCAVKVEKIRGI